MFYRLFFLFLTFISMSTISCSFFNKIIYHPKINQGNYLNEDLINKIIIGMTLLEIEEILGTPTLKDQFGSNIYYYIYRISDNELIIQKTLILKFDKHHVLIKKNFF